MPHCSVKRLRSAERPPGKLLSSVTRLVFHTSSFYFHFHIVALLVCGLLHFLKSFFFFFKLLSACTVFNKVVSQYFNCSIWPIAVLYPWFALLPKKVNNEKFYIGSLPLCSHMLLFFTAHFFFSSDRKQTEVKPRFRPIFNVNIFRKHRFQVPVCMFAGKQGFFGSRLLWSGIVWCSSACHQRINYRHIQNGDCFDRPNSLDKCTSTLQLTDEGHRLEFTCRLYSNGTFTVKFVTMQIPLNFSWN